MRRISAQTPIPFGRSGSHAFEAAGGGGGGVGGTGSGQESPTVMDTDWTSRTCRQELHSTAEHSVTFRRFKSFWKSRLEHSMEWPLHDISPGRLHTRLRMSVAYDSAPSGIFEEAVPLRLSERRQERESPTEAPPVPQLDQPSVPSAQETQFNRSTSSLAHAPHFDPHTRVRVTPRVHLSTPPTTRFK